MTLAVYINGTKSNSISIDNRSLHFGDGIFETLLFKQGKAQLLTEHLERLSKDCLKLKLLGLSTTELAKEIESLATSYPNAITKLIVSRRQIQRGYAISASSKIDIILIVNPVVNKKDHLISKICNTRLAIQPLLAKIKHLNRLEQVLASSELEQEVDEGLMFLHGHDKLIEAISNNIFIIKGTNIFTPILNEAGVEGVAKKVIMRIANEHKIAITECTINRQDLLNADAVFITNSIFGIRSVAKVNNVNYASNQPIIERLKKLTKNYFIE